MYCYNLIGTEIIAEKNCGVYQCQLPHASRPGALCDEIVEDGDQTGRDLEAHLTQHHSVTQLPRRFAQPSRKWSTGLLSCHKDPLAALDCLFCSCCFLGRLDTVSQVHWKDGVLPYVASYGPAEVGYTESACDMCVGTAVIQPLCLTVVAPLLCCGFTFRDEDHYVLCPMTSPAVFRTKHNANIDEDQCTTKCKMLWCCPLQACQTYRELRGAGVNPGLTCCSRYDTPSSPAAQPIPTLDEILAANHPGVLAVVAPGQWSPTISTMR
jgi:Cys-rich protein (TIGR01571 family)